jgi:hypothetical protein
MVVQGQHDAVYAMTAVLCRASELKAQAYSAHLVDVHGEAVVRLPKLGTIAMAHAQRCKN